MTRIREVDEAIKPMADILKAKREEFIDVVRNSITGNIDSYNYILEYSKVADDIIEYMETQKRARNR